MEHPDFERAKKRISRSTRSLPAEEVLPQFTLKDVAQIISSSSKALGYNGIFIVMLKHLDVCGVKYQIIKLLNLSLATLKVPHAWKMGWLVRLLKPGKDASKVIRTCR